MMISTTYVLWLLAAYTSICTAQDDEFKLPSYVNVCYRDDPKVADCLKKEIERLIPKLQSGAEDFDLASLDPMVFKNLVFDYKSAIIGGHLELPVISTEGLVKLKVTSIKPRLNNPKKFVLDFVGHMPVIKLKGSYNLTGNVISIPVRINGLIDFVLGKTGWIGTRVVCKTEMTPLGMCEVEGWVFSKSASRCFVNLVEHGESGHFTCGMVVEEEVGNSIQASEHVDLAYHIVGDVKTIGDYEYLDLKKFDFRLKGEGIKSAYVAGDQIVESRPALNRAVITALNSNWRILRDNMLPVLFPVTDKLMQNLFKDFFRKYPYDVLFPRRTRNSLKSNLTQPLS